MIKQIALGTLLTSVSGVALTTGLHFAAHGYIKAESKVNTYISASVTDLQARIRPLVGLKDGGLGVSPSREEIIAREAARNGFNPKIMYALIEAESNWRSDAERFEPALGTRSIGLTQVLGLHAGKTCKGITWPDLFQDDPNITCGSKILGSALKNQKTLYSALIEYNGGATCTKRARCLARASGHASKVLTRFAELVK